MRQIVSLLFFVLLSTSAFGQDTQDEINKIKADASYVYAQATSTTSQDEALENAKDLLALEVDSWLKDACEEQDISGYVLKSKENTEKITTRRGNLFRAFVYVRKSDILPYSEKENVMVVSMSNSEPQKVDSVSLVKTIAQEDKSIDDSKNVPSQVISFKPDSYESRMIGIKTFEALNNFINEGRQNGTIVDVGKYSNLPSSGKCYIFIHNRDGQVLASLKKTDSSCLNMATGKSDVISDYKGCGAIWIRINY